VDIFLGWYFWIQFHIVTWFRLIQDDNRWAVLLRDKPEKYKYRPYPMYSWGVLLFESTYEIRRLQAIDLSLNEQSRGSYNVILYIMYIYNSFVSYKQYHSMCVFFNNTIVDSSFSNCLKSERTAPCLYIPCC
jgi:hypothetical protein